MICYGCFSNFVLNRDIEYIYGEDRKKTLANISVSFKDGDYTTTVGLDTDYLGSVTGLISLEDALPISKTKYAVTEYDAWGRVIQKDDRI